MVSAVTLVCIMKSEENYILEWVAHHRLQGVGHFIVGDNDGSGPQSDLLIALDEAGIVERVDLGGIPYAQMGFFNDTLARMRDPHVLLGFIDADEFLVSVDQDRRAADLLINVTNETGAAAVGVNWRVFGSSGETEFRTAPVLERFHGHPPQAFAANKHIKTFARAGRTQGFSSNPHAVILKPGERYIHADGRPLAWGSAGPGVSADVIWDGAVINHYVIKSSFEYNQKKKQRGSAVSEGNAEVKRRAGYFEHFDRNEHSSHIKGDYILKLKAEMRVVAEIAGLFEH